MSQANSLHTTIAPPATYALAGTVLFDTSDEDQEGGRCYALQTATERLVVDPRDKGDPGDARSHGQDLWMISIGCAW